MRKLILIAILGIAVFVGHTLTAQGDTSKPNFIFYLSDDQDLLDYGCYGNPNVYTPTVDQLASEGMKFNLAYTGQAICAPSRSQLYTGRYPLRNNCYINHSNSYSEIKSVTTYLKELGYDVILAGKSHVGPNNVYDWTYNFGEERIPGVEPHIGVAMTKVKNYMDTTSRPYCIFMTSHYPHGPFKQSTSYSQSDVIVHPYMNGTSAQRAKYYESIKTDDIMISEIVAKVDSDEKFKNTVFVYSADHGNAGKFTVSEPGLRVPLIIRWPGKIQAGSESNALVHYTDILPTFIEMAGGEAPDDIDGSSFYDVIKGQSSTHQEHVYGVAHKQNTQGTNIFPSRMIRDARYKYIINTNSQEVSENNLGNDPAINVFIKRGANSKNNPYEELYDLETDEWEQNNLAQNADYAEIKEELANKLNDWLVDQGDFILDYPAPVLWSSLHPLDEQSQYNDIPASLEGSLSSSDIIPRDFNPAPLPPRNVRGEFTGATTFQLTWTPSTYSKDVTEYKVFVNDNQVLSLSDTVATLSNISPVQSYSFSVNAVNGTGQETSSREPFLLNMGGNTEQKELMENGDFEQGYDLVWRHQAVQGAVLDFSEETTNLIEGSNKALKVVATTLTDKGFQGSSIGNKLDVVKDVEYQVTFFAKKEFSSDAKINLVWQNPGSNCESQFIGEEITLTNNWTKYSHTFTSRATCNETQVKIWYLTEGATYYVDDVSCTSPSVSVKTNFAASFDPLTSYQTVDGFGAGIKRQTENLYRLGPEVQQEVERLCYQELEVNMIRFFVYHDLEPVNDNNDPMVLNTAALDWGRYDSNPNLSKSKYVGESLQNAQELSTNGFDYIIGNCNSAPAWLKTNGSHNNGGTLIAGQEDEYSEFLIAFLKGMKSIYNIDVNVISPTNEPDFPVTYESMNTTPQELMSILKNLNSRLITEGLDEVLISSAECFAVNVSNPSRSSKNYIEAMFEDEEVKNAVDIVATHTYADGGHNTNWSELKQVSAEKPIWVTESAVLNQGNDVIDIEDYGNTMNNAENTIKWIIRGFKEGGLTAFMHHTFYELHNEEDVDPNSNKIPSSLILFDDDGHINVTKRYYSFKHFTNFIKPGYVRVAFDVGESDLHSIAFKSPDLNEVAVQLYNEKNVAKELPVFVPPGVKRVNHYITSDTENDNCRLIGNIDFDTLKSGGDTVMINLPAKSLHTLQFDFGGIDEEEEEEEVLFADENRDNQLLLYPNPVQQGEELNLVFPSISKGQLNIIDMSGHVVRKEEINVNRGENNIVKIKTTDISKGVYIISYKGAGKRLESRIIIQ